jgi:hypothetical protein
VYEELSALIKHLGMFRRAAASFSKRLNPTFTALLVLCFKALLAQNNQL